MSDNSNSSSSSAPEKNRQAAFLSVKKKLKLTIARYLAGLLKPETQFITFLLSEFGRVVDRNVEFGGQASELVDAAVSEKSSLRAGEPGSTFEKLRDMELDPLSLLLLEVKTLEEKKEKSGERI